MTVKYAETLVATGTAGAVVSYLFGEIDIPMQALVLFVVVDYLMGIACAAIFKKSAKTENGGLSSAVGFKGIFKKCCILAFVLVAHWVDAVTGTEYIRNGVCIALIANEAISILENAGLMGAPIPPILSNAIDLLKKKDIKH